MLFTLLKRYFLFILLVAFAIACIAALQTALFQKTEYKGTLFLTVGIDAAKEDLSTVKPDHKGTTEGADNFTETVMGWLRNPFLAEEVAKNAGYNTASKNSGEIWKFCTTFALKFQQVKRQRNSV